MKIKTLHLLKLNHFSPTCPGRSLAISILSSLPLCTGWMSVSLNWKTKHCIWQQINTRKLQQISKKIRMRYKIMTTKKHTGHVHSMSNLVKKKTKQIPFRLIHNHIVLKQYLPNISVNFSNSSSALMEYNVNETVKLHYTEESRYTYKLCLVSYWNPFHMSCCNCKERDFCFHQKHVVVVERQNVSKWIYESQYTVTDKITM